MNLDKTIFDRFSEETKTRFKKFHKQNYNPSWKTNNQSFDMNNFIKKSKQSIVVTKIDDENFRH